MRSVIKKKEFSDNYYKTITQVSIFYCIYVIFLGCAQATPHAVRGSSVKGVSRETFAVFMEPMWMEPMNFPEGVAIGN